MRGVYRKVGFLGLKNVGCGIFRSKKCGMSDFIEVGEGFFVKINVYGWGGVGGGGKYNI